MTSTILFLPGLLAAGCGFVSPPVALAARAAFGLLFRHPFPQPSVRASKLLLQLSVVGLGFGMNLHEVVRAGRSGFLYTLLTIAFTMMLGILLGRALSVNKTCSYLISTGTAICGGSAIAALGPIIEATDEQVSLGTVSVLNSVALLTLPAIATLLRLSQTQFGLWAALAIHNTSSVVGAATKYERSRPPGGHDS